MPCRRKYNVGMMAILSKGCKVTKRTFLGGKFLFVSTVYVLLFPLQTVSKSIVCKSGYGLCQTRLTSTSFPAWYSVSLL